ncbi:MAG: phosphoribosylformylglycinamidine cyclo-ligase [Chloroflexota bacterium]
MPGAEAATTYAGAGVNVAAAHLATERLKTIVGQTRSEGVIADVGPFAGLFSLGILSGYREPVLVSSTDGVGTKIKVAGALGRYDTIGHDLVNHCINDIAVHGARPLFFLDYLALNRVDPDLVATVVGGVAAACRTHGVALLGGETAEMPDVYPAGEIDLAGFIVGIVDRERAVLGHSVALGDVLVGLPSSGLHTNGYTLARRALPTESWDQVHPELGRTIGDALLEPHRCYLDEIQCLIGVGARAFAHITGGGFPENVARVLPPDLAASIDVSSWAPTPIFQLIAATGVTAREMYSVFNMGIGLVAVLPPDSVREAQRLVTDLVVIGNVTTRQRDEGVRLLNLDRALGA